MSRVSSSSAPPGAAPGSNPGLFAHLARLLGGLAGYGKARAALAGIEGKEAAIHYAIVLGLALAGGVVLVFGYLFVVITVAFALAAWIGGEHAWLWVTGGIALLHLLLAAGLVFVAWRRIKKPMLGCTFEELRKDKEWLNQLAKQR